MTDLSYLQAVVIGAIQGVTELFPLSSLGHSVLVPAWIGGSWRHLVTEQSSSAAAASPYLSFLVALHVATALALVVFYLRTWVRIVVGLVTSIVRRRIETPVQRLAWLIVIATIPAGILGLAFQKPLQHLFAKPEATAIFLTVNGVVLLVAEQLVRRSRRRIEAAGSPSHDLGPGAVGVDQRAIRRLRWRDALTLGLAQSTALLAGISRSGITMVAGLTRDLDHENAANLAFLLATPIILAAGALKLPDLAKPAAAGVRGPALAGAVVAAVLAYLSVRFLTRYFENRSLRPFGVYCLVFGLVSVVHFG